mmetsp:Transcript_17643/g.37064  ORF Transcript_17643/g.37064 Transcript_17643/m.37064 type:complete len:222 (+) Transcript_17643:186-851(+)
MRTPRHVPDVLPRRRPRRRVGHPPRGRREDQPRRDRRGGRGSGVERGRAPQAGGRADREVHGDEADGRRGLRRGGDGGTTPQRRLGEGRGHAVLRGAHRGVGRERVHAAEIQRHGPSLSPQRPLREHLGLLRMRLSGRRRGVETAPPRLRGGLRLLAPTRRGRRLQSLGLGALPRLLRRVLLPRRRLHPPLLRRRRTLPRRTLLPLLLRLPQRPLLRPTHP